MARETKLGMLVGLGFIVCFAIILENRGRRDRVGPQMPHEMLAQSTAASDADSPNLAERRARDYGRQKAGLSGRDGGPGKPKPGPAAASRRSDRSATPKDRFTQRRQVAQVTPPGDPATTTPLEPTAEDARPAGRSSVSNDTETSLAATSPPPDPEPQPAPQGQQAAQPGRRYTVRKGDSLSRIAHQQYGTRSKRVIDAIFDVNRAVLSSPDQIRSGQELVLPVIEGIAAPADEPAGQSANRPASPPRQAPAQDYRHYQIKKGDRYATIAKEQLGDASRWKEIAELNRDIFPDPAKIQYGVRIRLPASSGPKQTGQRS